jgi:hypothetical protein
MPISPSALVVEDGSGLTSGNSYLSISGANDYHAAHGNDGWAAATSGDRAQALVDATEYVDHRWRFVGQRLASGQALSWPRLGAYDADGFLWEDIVPFSIEKATAEYALRAISGELAPDPTGLAGPVTSRSETIGPHSESVSYSSPVREDVRNFPQADSIVKRSGLVRNPRPRTIRG